MRWLSFALLLSLTSCPATAPARDGPQWGNTPENISAWIRGLMQPDEPTASCCGDADAYEADSFDADGDRYIATITGHRFTANYPIGAKFSVPNNKLKYDAGKSHRAWHHLHQRRRSGAVLCSSWRGIRRDT